MSRTIEAIIKRDPFAVITLGATVVTGLALLVSSNRAWLLVLIIPGVLAWVVYVARRPAKWFTSLTEGFGVLVFLSFLVAGQDRDLVSGLFSFLVPCSQILIFTILLFPVAYFWKGPEGQVDADEHENVGLIAVLVLAAIAFCVGIGWLVNQNTGWIWLILGLWVLVFPRGFAAHSLSPLSGVFGFLGLMLVVVSVLMGWIPQYMMFTASGYGFGIMLLITGMMWIGFQQTRRFPARWLSNKR